MATVRPITRKGKDGSTLRRWQLDYVDSDGRRHRKNFERKRDADAERIRIERELQTGTHIPDTASRTVLQGLEAWLDHVDMLARAGRRSVITWEKYRSHVRTHIAMRPIAGVLLSKLRPADVAAFGEQLEHTLSPAMARKVWATFRMGIRYCGRHQWLASDPTMGVRIEARAGADDDQVEIPPKADLKALLKASGAAADGGRSRALVCLMLYCGLRMGEVRALTRGALALTGTSPSVTVSQAADQRGAIKSPKTRAGRRRVPLTPGTVRALKAWLKSAPANELHLVFPSGAGRPENHSNLLHRWWEPLMEAAGLCDDGRPRFTPHTLRHAAASLWIEMGLKPKKVQGLMGHANLTLTMDLYGHLWPDDDADAAIARAMERQLG